MIKNISLLLTQVIAVIFGALTVSGVSVDPAVQADVQAQTGDIVNSIAGLAVMVTAFVGSIGSIITKIKGKE